MKTEKKQTPKTIKLSFNNHTRLSKTVKLRTDTFDDLVGRALNVYEAFPKLKDKIVSLYHAQINACAGNAERKAKVKKEYNEFMAWVGGLEK